MGTPLSPLRISVLHSSKKTSSSHDEQPKNRKNRLTTTKF